jgi:hypothetical protein
MPGYVLAATETGPTVADEQPDSQTGKKSDRSGAKPDSSPETADKKSPQPESTPWPKNTFFWLMMNGTSSIC